MLGPLLAAGLALVAALTPPARAQEEFRVAHGVGAYRCLTGGVFEGGSGMALAYVDCERGAWAASRNCAGLCEATRGCWGFWSDEMRGGTLKRCMCMLMGSLPVPLGFARGPWGWGNEPLACVRAGGAAWPQKAELPKIVPYTPPPWSGLANPLGRESEFGPAGANGYKCFDGQIALGRWEAARRIVGTGAAGLAECRGRCEGSAGCVGFNLFYGDGRGGRCAVMLSVHAPADPPGAGAPAHARGAYCNRLAGPVGGPRSARGCPPGTPDCVPPERTVIDPRPPTIEQPRPAAPAPGKK